MVKNLEQIYIEHSDTIYRYIFLHVRHKELAEDLTQETFYKAFKRIHTYKNQSKLSTWLIKIAKNTVYDYFRRKKIIQFFHLKKKDMIDDTFFLPENEMIRREELTLLHTALFNIKPHYREVLILRKINENTIAETAYILDWTETKVKSTMARAFAALKKEVIKLGGVIDE